MATNNSTNTSNPSGVSAGSYTSANITVNAAGLLTAAANGSGGGGGGITWNNISGTTQTAASNNGYVIGNSSSTVVTLPATCALGDVVIVQGSGAGGWFLDPGSGQTIKMGQGTTSTGALGSLGSAFQYDNVQVVCIVANTTWAVLSALSSGLTVA